MSAVRPPAVAGSFYPADAVRLRAAVEAYLAAANGAHVAAPAKAVIAPHAGYVYSGPVAGHAFAALGDDVAAIRRAVVVGPAHFVPFHGIAVPSADAFRTPLGDVPLDRAAIEELGDLAQAGVADAPHEPEHALEVELPFLQAVLGDFALVPLLVGAATSSEVAEVLDRLWGGPDTVLVISSDLSLYEPYGHAREHDAATAAAIECLDAASLGPRDACGWLPVGGLLLAAGPRAMRVARLDLRNSGDTAGRKDQVVGYGAWAFCEA
jgi:AmmeMemoRadiSam system protein B